MEIKKNIPNNTVTRKLSDFDPETGNVYKSINIIAKRANQIAAELKQELNKKLADFEDYTKNYSHMSWEEYLKTKGGGKK